MNEPSPEEIAALDDKLQTYSAAASAMEKPAYIKSLIYGHKKVGKTTEVSKCAERPLLFAVDSGWTSLKDWPEVASRVTVVEMQGIRHFEAFVKALTIDSPLYQKNDHLIIDPLNKLVREHLVYLQENAKPSQADARVYWTTKVGNTDPNFEPFTTPGMGDFNATLHYFRRWLYPLFRIKKHITLIAHEREPGITEKSKPKDIRAAIPGQTYEMIAQECDLLGRMEANGDNRTISFNATGNVDAGSRFRNLHGKVIESSRLPELYDGRWNGI